MTPRDVLADGRLADAIVLQEPVVRDRPDDPAARLFLFELLTLAGRLNDARDQLRAIESTDLSWPDARRRFARLLKAEAARRRGRRTKFLDKLPMHIKARWRAYQALRADRPDEALTWIDRADATSPSIVGHVDGREFEGLRDTDDRFGSVLEVFLGSFYVWYPLERLRRITLAPAVGVLDAAFRPVRLLTRGPELSAILPLLYPGSHAAGGVFATGLETDWPDAGGPACGVGARVWMVGEEELVLGDCRQFELRPG